MIGTGLPTSAGRSLGRRRDERRARHGRRAGLRACPAGGRRAAVFTRHGSAARSRLTLAMGATGQWNLDHIACGTRKPAARPISREQLLPDLARGLIKLLLERGLVTAEEIARGVVMRAAPVDRRVHALTGSPRRWREAAPTARRDGRRALCGRRRGAYAPDESARHIPGCRAIAAARTRSIVMLHGAHVFPDTNASGGGEAPAMALYGALRRRRTVGAATRRRAAVHVDCWEPYLDMA